MIRAAVLAIAGAALCACADIQPVEIPKTKSVAAAVACISDQAKRELEAACPQLRTDAQILALDDYRAVQALRADHGKASVCIAKLQTAVDVCAKVPAAEPPPPLDGRRE